jgi:DNA-directed RNA polymerase subunit RPC12/RpoP
MPRLRTALRSKRENTLECPYCRNTDLRYCETDLTIRHLNRFEDNVLMIDSRFDCDGDGDDARLLCVDCGKESKLPKNVELDFE